MTYSAPPCYFCAHRDRDYPGWRCKAFPENIPDKFLEGGQGHKTPEPGQTGNYVYKERKGR